MARQVIPEAAKIREQFEGIRKLMSPQEFTQFILSGKLPASQMKATGRTDFRGNVVFQTGSTPRFSSSLFDREGKLLTAFPGIDTQSGLKSDFRLGGFSKRSEAAIDKSLLSAEEKNTQFEELRLAFGDVNFRNFIESGQVSPAFAKQISADILGGSEAAGTRTGKIVVPPSDQPVGGFQTIQRAAIKATSGEDVPDVVKLAQAQGSAPPGFLAFLKDGQGAIARVPGKAGGPAPRSGNVLPGGTIAGESSNPVIGLNELSSANPVARQQIGDFAPNTTLAGPGGSGAFTLRGGGGNVANGTGGFVGSSLEGFRIPITTRNLDFLRQEPVSIGESGPQRNPLLESGLDTRFNEIRQNLGFPSTVEELRQEVENEQFQQTLGQIDKLFEQRLAEARGGFAERGLLGPGGTSDIAENALAQIRGQAATTGSQAATQLRLGEIERLSQRERDILGLSESLLGKEFSGEERAIDRGLTRDITQAELQAQRDVSFAGLANQIELGAPAQNLAERQFSGNLGFNFAELAQRGQLTREGFDLERELQQLQGQQRLGQIEAGRERSGLDIFTGITGGLANLFSFNLGGGKGGVPRGSAGTPFRIGG